MEHGHFVISLDFELFWGVRDKETIENYGAHIEGVWSVLPKILSLFNQFNVKATFATVGFLFATNKKELINSVPTIKPNYNLKELSPYNGHFDIVNENEDDKHFSPSLIEMIRENQKHEIATHTHSHYYCFEQGQNREDFKADLIAAKNIASKNKVDLKSIVFPRNQINEQYLDALNDLGLTSYRGNEKVWFKNKMKKFRQLKRAFSLLDAYINLSGHHSYLLQPKNNGIPYNFPASRFLRPYSHRLKMFENLKVQRILGSMEYAAKNNEVYHLWWHPHNYGINQNENLFQLKLILEKYAELNSKYNFNSSTMSDLANILNAMKDA